MLHHPWKDLTLIALDTETSGAYPLKDELCEIAAVKWQAGEVVGEYQTLVRPTEPMSDFIIGIHGITNEMVADAPVVEDVISDFYQFIKGGVVIAHHAPFDLGFLAYEFEKAGLDLPKEPALCSSLISRKVVTDSKNHKLQTLIPHLGIEQGTAHRALDDTKACLEVALHCFRKLGEKVTLGELLKLQEKDLSWKNYSIEALQEHSAGQGVIRALQEKKNLKIIYSGGSKKYRPREIKPTGLVRNPDGDFIMAYCFESEREKRFYLNKIQVAEVLDQ